MQLAKAISSETAFSPQNPAAGENDRFARVPDHGQGRGAGLVDRLFGRLRRQMNIHGKLCFFQRSL